ncbi:hypothetical protein ATC1_13278 [Flexilinea flocculi]|uniref:Uncharacterized protein n=1 Tax=Flexilinea flocculi TaxID=1678840 RepID=A0A0S7BR78_9CHLR|nr:hypothetical protein ATC1_13278 [Flexilinea flocculi]
MKVFCFLFIDCDDTRAERLLGTYKWSETKNFIEFNPYTEYKDSSNCLLIRLTDTNLGLIENLITQILSVKMSLFCYKLDT